MQTPVILTLVNGYTLTINFHKITIKAQIRENQFFLIKKRSAAHRNNAMRKIILYQNVDV